MSRGLIFVALLGLSIATCLHGKPSGGQGKRPAFNRSGGKIVGGTDAKPGEYPHQASIQLDAIIIQEHFCGGSVIHPEWVLTAAHCFEAQIIPIPEWAVKVVVGESDRTVDEGTEQERGVAEYITHEGFEMEDQIRNDIALIRLSEPLELNEYVNLIALAPVGVEPSTVNGSRDCVATGWGSEKLWEFPLQVLQQVRLDAIPDEICEETWNDLAANQTWFSAEQNICAGTAEGHESVCQGDSGGPLMCKADEASGLTGEYLFGVTSWGSDVECGEPGDYAVWTQVNNFIDWINEKTGLKFPLENY